MTSNESAMLKVGWTFGTIAACIGVSSMVYYLTGEDVEENQSLGYTTGGMDDMENKNRFALRENGNFNRSDGSEVLPGKLKTTIFS